MSATNFNAKTETKPSLVLSNDHKWPINSLQMKSWIIRSYIRLCHIHCTDSEYDHINISWHARIKKTKQNQKQKCIEIKKKFNWIDCNFIGIQEILCFSSVFVTVVDKERSSGHTNPLKSKWSMTTPTLTLILTLTLLFCQLNTRWMRQL